MNRSRVLRTLATVAVLALLVTGGVFASQVRKDCPGHWHSTFLVFVDDHRVQFSRPVFYQTPRGIHDHHMHADDQVIHMHPQFVESCITLQAFMGRLGIQLTDTSVSFNDNFGGNAGVYEDNETADLQVHLQRFGGEWREVSWDSVRTRQMRPGDKLLITYGELDEETVLRQKAMVRDLGPNYLPPRLHDQASAILANRTSAFA